MDIMGTVTFAFVVAKPLMGSKPPLLVKQTVTAECLQPVGHGDICSIESVIYPARFSIVNIRKDSVKTLLVTAIFSLGGIIYRGFSLS
ncbi:hypothetical protein N7447_004102 [Penicillium robsamsonii]|uniref:uncharacterized protein n=1 Tax=Penicillium robsamsonii TaxID=1792511 RepID=UPI00254916B6|nr:uncharacterized protein N7447_004102 [Penicillium robsamsonii]KAJ5827339.1 hypothetical protein N7447_004102 [Penicillium robsamsonii]